MYDPASFTFGVELEYGNASTKNPLPPGNVWNHKDYTIVSSTGVANDPLGELYEFGGEINTRPTNTIGEQVDEIQMINACLNPAPIVNYRSNLHIHVRVPGLNENLEDCKKLLRYIDKYQQEAFSIVERIPVPVSFNKLPIVYEWEMKRYKRRLVSHQHVLPPARVKEMLEARTVQEFYEAHASPGKKGRNWFITPRAGINLRQMWDSTNTIEFRHFPGTLEQDQMQTCLRWCEAFLVAALNTGETPTEVRSKMEFMNFPSFAPYEFETEQGYQFTNLAHNTRPVVQERLNLLRQRLDIDHCTSKELFRAIKTIKQ